MHTLKLLFELPQRIDLISGHVVVGDGWIALGLPVHLCNVMTKRRHRVTLEVRKRP